MKEYRCTRNALYLHNCLGHDDLTVRQGHYIHANSDEEAWQEMARRFPNETAVGFTVDEWQGGFSVKVVKVDWDEQGNLVEVDEQKPSINSQPG